MSPRKKQALHMLTTLYGHSLTRFLSLNRRLKQLLLIGTDFTGLLIIPLLAIWVRFGSSIFPVPQYAVSIALFPLLCIPAMAIQGVYRSSTRFLGYRFFHNTFVAIALAVLVWSSLIFMAKLQFPRSGILIAWMLALLFVIATRVIARAILNFLSHAGVNKAERTVVIFGAGESGKQLAGALKRTTNTRIAGFVDDDRQLRKVEIESICVFAREDLAGIIEAEGVTHVYIALPSASISERREVIQFLEPLPVKVKTLPGLEELLDGNITSTDVREVDINDLLGRDAVPPIPELMQRCVTDRVVMVTGAGGSIGSEICRTVLKLRPKTLVLYELSEFALYTIEQELLNLHAGVEIVAVLGNVCNQDRIERTIRQHSVSTIYHAAAYKHVPLVEKNITEGILNNTFGTYACAKAAASCGVKHFVLISTDKAVRPTNFMGASKRLAEMVLQAMQDEHPDTRFIMVRFGNVLGSSGSVIPLFRKQIAKGGPVTVTHKDITRYFMTIPEAASLVIQAGAMGSGGDVFVLEMGEPVKIYELAKRIIRLSGLTVRNGDQGDIAIEVTGLRPGEKLYEELLIGDSDVLTEHPRIRKAQEQYVVMSKLSKQLEQLERNCANYEVDRIKQQITRLVEGFSQSSKASQIVKSPEQRGSANVVKLIEVSR